MKIKHIDVPFKVKSVDDEGHFEGYASVFGVLDSYREIVAKGAFKKSIKTFSEKGRMPPVLWQHSAHNPIGVHNELKEDSHGLFIKGQLVMEVEQAREARALMSKGAVTGISIGFVPKQWEYDKDEDVLTLTEIDLWENSIVTFPANPEAQVSDIKTSILGLKENPDIRELEAILRDAGLSKSQAKALLADGFKGIVGRDDQQQHRDDGSFWNSESKFN